MKKNYSGSDHGEKNMRNEKNRGGMDRSLSTWIFTADNVDVACIGCLSILKLNKLCTK